MAHGQDFDPHGRRHHAPSPGAGGAGTRPGPGPGHPVEPAEGASSAALIDRYTHVVLAQPGALFPLQRLAQLFRDRDGNLAALLADMAARAAQPGADAYAATVALAGLEKIDGRPDDAVRTYERAVLLKPGDPTAPLALAHVLEGRGDATGARKEYELALGLQKAPADREQTLRTLMGLALDAKDWDAAKHFHGELVKAEPTSLFVRGELARALYARAEFERAEAEFTALVAASAGDNRTLAPALKELGQAQAKAHKNVEAVATLKRALAAAGSEAAVRTQIYETIAEIYRADQQLPVLIAQIEAEHPSDFGRLALLGSLYEETGNARDALATYRKALAISPRQIDLRLKMIRLLQSQGELDRAIAEYDGLIRSAPSNPEFVFEQCDALLQRGDRARAVRLLSELEARARGDEDTMNRLGEFYARIGEAERSLKIMTQLAEAGGNDPSHLVDLGDRYFQDGNVPLAVQTWKRMLTSVTPRARALAALADVYLEHDMVSDSLVAVREATQLEPQNQGYRKQLASTLEKARSYREALILWGDLGAKANKAGDKTLAHEARTHLVTLWGLEHTIEQQVPGLSARFNGAPPDLEAGRTLAEVLLHLRKLPDAETALVKIVRLAPGDEQSYLALERVLVQENKIEAAIGVLESLVKVDPKRARELYERMAQYAMQLYRDDDAVKYAARAVELNPDDAEGHRRLGEMYRSRQDTDHAILEFRAALGKNDRLFVVYFELADLLLSKGDTEGADRLFRRVLQSAPDEELVARAARLSMQINLGKGTLESLEQDLLPLAIGNPQRKVYRRLLMEIYGNLTFGLVQRIKHGAGKDADDARQALARVGGRAVKPLLDALADGDAGQQRIAIDVLGYVENKNAGPALFAFATGSAETSLRVRAMIACGALADPELLPRYASFLFPKTRAPGEGVLPSDAVVLAASWGVARLGDPRAVPLLRSLVREGSADVRAFALIGLGNAEDRASVREVAQIARNAGAGHTARAAAAYALGALGAEDEQATLLTLAEDPDPLPRQMALLSLAQLGADAGSKGGPAVAAMADAVFAVGEEDNARVRRSGDAIQRAGALALTRLAGVKSVGGPAKDPLPQPDGPLDVEADLERLVPPGLTANGGGEAVVRFAAPLQRAALDAIQTSSDGARAVLHALSAGEGSLAPFLGPGTGGAHDVARAIYRALEPAIVTLARHPDASIRTKAIVLLARSTSDAAASAVVQATNDASEGVQRVALAAIGDHRDPRAAAAVGAVLAHRDNWSIRVLAAEALGRLGAAGDAAEVTPALREAATTDAYALVREAALRALSSFDPRSAAELAGRMARDDPEPRVRDVARDLASALH